tara:strand:+ start:89 stop:406 length:318 start_codon:yes stop_codon:yes gene_type:complete
MPCQSYEDPRDYSHEKEIRDRLARIACKALTHLEELGDVGGLEVLILKDPEIADWWREHKEDDRRAKEKEAARKRKAAEKAALIRKKDEIKARLTPEELKILGVK